MPASELHKVPLDSELIVLIFTLGSVSLYLEDFAKHFLLKLDVSCEFVVEGHIVPDQVLILLLAVKCY